MPSGIENATIPPDPAAVLASALSLWHECRNRAASQEHPNLSECYSGMDQFMREVMRVANQFETWACSHIDFNRLDGVWPYLLEEKFGLACLATILPTELGSFDDSDCFRVALRLECPVISDGKLPIPVDVNALNPLTESVFKKFRIQTARDAVEGNFSAPYCFGDEPFDPEFNPPFFSLYGVAADGLLEHIADRSTYAEAVRLARNLAPGIDFPDKP